MATTGADTYTTWKLETSYASSVTGSAKSFGHDVKLSAQSAKNNIQLQYGLGNQEATTHVAGLYGGSFSLDYTLGDPWMFAYITGNNASTTGLGPYTHTFLNTASSLPETTYSKTMKSIAVEHGVDLSTDVVTTFKGCVMKSLSMDMVVGDPVKCKNDFDYATEALTTSVSSNVNSTDDAYTFAYASFEFPTDTTISNVQSLNLTINRNAELKGSLGNRLPQFFLTKKSDYTLKATLPVENSTLLEYLYGTTSLTAPAQKLTEPAGLKIVLDNELSSTNQRQITLEFVGALVDERASPADVNEMKTQDLSFIARQWKVAKAINNQPSQP